MNKKTILIAFLVILLVSVIGVSSYFFIGKSGQERKPEIDTSNWKTYRNEKYGFEVKYPSNLVVILEKEQIISRPDGSEVTFPITINFLTEGGLSARDFTNLTFLDYKGNLEGIILKNTFLGESPQHPDSISEFSITQLGENQIYFLNHYLSEGRYGVIYFIPGKDRVAMLELFAWATDDWMDPNWKLEAQPFYQLINQILSTWRYIQHLAL